MLINTGGSDRVDETALTSALRKERLAWEPS